MSETDPPETDPRHEAARAVFNELSARLTPVRVELATSWVHPHADILAQSMGVEAAMLRAAASFAGLISKQHKIDMDLFIGMARAEFDIIALKNKAEAVADAAAKAKPEPALHSEPSLRSDSDDTGVRHWPEIHHPIEPSAPGGLPRSLAMSDADAADMAEFGRTFLAARDRRAARKARLAAQRDSGVSNAYYSRVGTAETGKTYRFPSPL
jgi:hypothetical protein